MSFYVWDTPEVAKLLNTEYSSKHHFYVSTDGTRNAVYKDDSRTFIGKSSIEQMNLLGIPEYKLHHSHGLIPANSKLFKEDVNKEQKEEKQMKQETNKVFEVGDKCVIRNPNNYEVMEEVKKYFIDKECKIVAKFELSTYIGYGGLRITPKTVRYKHLDFCKCYDKIVEIGLDPQKLTIEDVQLLKIVDNQNKLVYNLFIK